MVFLGKALSYIKKLCSKSLVKLYYKAEQNLHVLVEKKKKKLNKYETKILQKKQSP